MEELLIMHTLILKSPSNVILIGDIAQKGELIQVISCYLKTLILMQP